jgi:hypothetical protein
MINFYADIETKANYHSTMIGFSLEFKRWYVVVRGPKGRVYLAFGFAKRMPVMTPTGTCTLEDCVGTWPGDETDEELLDTLRSIR